MRASYRGVPRASGAFYLPLGKAEIALVRPSVRGHKSRWRACTRANNDRTRWMRAYQWAVAFGRLRFAVLASGARNRSLVGPIDMRFREKVKNRWACVCSLSLSLSLFFSLFLCARQTTFDKQRVVIANIYIYITIISNITRETIYFSYYWIFEEKININFHE